MDPGTALSVVSLGIQVCQGLIEYYDGWKGYENDIREACNSLKGLNKTFTHLQDRLSALQATSPTNVLTVQAVDSLAACKDGVKKLEKKLAKLRKESPSGFWQKAQASGLQVVYPLRKSTLEKLKEIVQDLMQHLNLDIQVMLLDDTGQTRVMIDRVEKRQTLILGNTSETKNSLNRVENTQALVLDNTHETMDTVTRVEKSQESTAAGVQKLLTANEGERLDRILNWLSAPDCSTTHKAACEKYEAGTGQWFLDCAEYDNWLSGPSPRLWLHSKAGCCKTVLCSTIIENVKHQLQSRSNCAYAYFYFSFNDEENKQSYRSFLLSMINDLSKECPIILELSAAYEKEKRGQPDISILEEVFVALLKRTETAYIIVDGLDECPESEDGREKVMEGLKWVAKRVTGLRVLITSRREPDIERFMQSWCDVRLALSEQNVNADIDVYVKRALATHRKLRLLPEKSKREIEDTFHKKAEGM